MQTAPVATARTLPRTAVVLACPAAYDNQHVCDYCTGRAVVIDLATVADGPYNALLRYADAMDYWSADRAEVAAAKLIHDEGGAGRAFVAAALADIAEYETALAECLAKVAP